MPVSACAALTGIGIWCPEPESNRYASLKAADFKSAVSTNFTIGAHFAIGARANVKYCISHTTKAIKKGSLRFPFQNLERENGFEPSTYTLARYRSTN